MFIKFLKLLLLIPFVLMPVFGQDSDSTDAEESRGREMFTSVDFSFSQDKGNTDFISKYYGFDFTLNGDVGPLTDTELYLGFNRSDDKFDGIPFTDDQYITFKFDIWAHQQFSPFLFLQKSFDNSLGLKNRLNYGLGGKVALPLGLSISYAFLAESETYEIPVMGNIDSTLNDADYYYYEDYYTYDTTYTNVDSTSEFFRHSIRPKIKLKLMDGGLVFDYRSYFKPRVDNFEEYLLEHELKVSIATFYEMLSIDFNYTNKYNTRYDANKNKDLDIANLYKDTDESISIGFSFMF